jgi:hypothetical protein
VYVHGCVRQDERCTVADAARLTIALLLQEIVAPQFVVTGLSIVVTPLFSYLFIFRLGWGLHGAALAVDVVQVSPHVFAWGLGHLS